jgi:hypothetical protein
MSKTQIGCINPHGYYPFPANRDVCPECQAIRARTPVFSPRHGLRYRWWKDIPWGTTATVVVVVMLYLMLAAVLFAWTFDWKPSW